MNYMLLKIDPETGNSFDTIKLVDRPYIYGMAYDGEFIYYTTGYDDISVLDINTKKLVRTIIVPKCRHMEAIGVTEQHIVVTDSYDEKVFILDKITGDIVTSWFSRGVYGLACVESDKSIFVVDYNNVVYEYGLMTGTLLNSYTPETYYIHSLSYSGSAEVLFALDLDNIIYAINPQNGSIIKKYPAMYGACRSLRMKVQVKLNGLDCNQQRELFLLVKFSLLNQQLPLINWYLVIILQK
jgi:WD40 repeat protein